MIPQSELATHPTRLKAANLLRSFAAVGVLLVSVTLLMLVFGRTGERIAVQMCVNVAAVVALAIYCGNTGNVSFGHGAFMAVGAYLSGILTMPVSLQGTALPSLPSWLNGHELSIGSSLLLVTIVGFLMALLTGFAIARLREASAAISTLGLLIIIHSIAVGAREITRGSQTFYGVPRITDVFFVLLAAIVFILIARTFRESRWGLFARSVRDDQDAATALGINPFRSRLVAWCLSGTLATVAGALQGHILGAFSPATFYISLAFAQVVMMIVGGMSSVGGTVIGVIAVTMLQNSVRNLEGGFSIGSVEFPEVFGLTTVALGVAILFVIWLRPQGIVGMFELGPSADARILNRISNPTLSAQIESSIDACQLVGTGLSKSFAGLAAVDGVSLEVPTSRITGLIGPNGAGKSTLVNLLTRKYDAESGSIFIGNTDLSRVPCHSVIRYGVARSFQNLRMFRGLTVFENVFVAASAAGYTRKHAEAITVRELAAFDLAKMTGMRAESLPYGARKRLEIARALAQNPSLLLLDEPAAGMNPAETDDLANRLHQVRQSRNIGILLIDHDLRFMNRLADQIVVMNRGRKIAIGTPDEVRSNALVVEAYIGRGRTAHANKFVQKPNSMNIGELT